MEEKLALSVNANRNDKRYPDASLTDSGHVRCVTEARGSVRANLIYVQSKRQVNGFLAAVKAGLRTSFDRI